MSLDAAKDARRRRSSSLVYKEPPESLEQLSDQSALPNLNAEWVNAKGAWAIHFVLIFFGKILFDIIPGMSQEASWTLVNLSYVAGSYLMFHYVRGVPFDFNSGAYDNLNMWEQIVILSTFYYGYACSQVPGGWAAQKIGGRRVLLLSFLLWSLTCAFVPLDPNRTIVLVIARLLVGVAQGFIFPSIHTVLAQWVPPHERSRSVSFTTSGMYLGAAMGMLMLPSLVKYRGPQSVFLAEAALGAMWSLLWFSYAADPPRSEHPKATASGFGETLLPLRGSSKLKAENGVHPTKTPTIPWKRIVTSLPVWAIVVNNFTFHYALYVLMNWLPTYFELGLQISLQEMGSSKMMPYLNMFIFSNIGGVIADHFVTRRILSITKTRKLLNTVGFIVASLALMALPYFRTPGGALFCSSVALGFLALGRAGFAVNHMDIAPRYAGIIMGVSNTAGTLAGIVGVDLTGRLLEAAKEAQLDLTSPESWTSVFFIPGLLCIFSSFVFLVLSTGERIFD